MRKSRSIIAPIAPERITGYVWKPKCARCGAAARWHACHDSDHVRDEELGVNGSCLVCDGHGGWYQCHESPQDCLDGPLPGRSRVQRGEIEWFAVRIASHA